MQNMNMMQHCLHPLVLERQLAYLQWQQQQHEETNNFSIETYLSLQGEGLMGDGWPILTSNAHNPIDIRNEEEEEEVEEEEFRTTPTTTTTTSTLSYSTSSTQVGKEKSAKKRKAHKSLMGDSDDEEKRKKGEQGSEGEKKQRNKREEIANSAKEENVIQKPDFIHVRARRGQATDSHSLAERVRRERISERMKYLQGLVPGCNKITGKAGMLDEIINYVQSLQRQVEFLSMKLASVNPSPDFNMDTSFNKEMNMPLELQSSLLQYNTLQIAEPFLSDSSLNIQRTATSGWDNLFGVEFLPGRGSAFPFQLLQGNFLFNNLKREM